jgi:hypothetical protein
MIFYNYEGYFGKPKVEVEETSMGPSTLSFNFKKWQWMLMIDKLVKELNLTPDAVYDMNYIDCLNWLSMFNDRDKYKEAIQRQQLADMKITR